MVQCSDRITVSTDAGADDVSALTYLLGSVDECELGGVIAGYGDVDVNMIHVNTCVVLDLFGRADIPMFLGSEHPSQADAFIFNIGCAQFHGDDGLGNTRLVRSGAPADGACVPGDDMSADVPDEVVSVGRCLAGDIHARLALDTCSCVNRSQSVDHPQPVMPTALASGGKRRCSVDTVDGIGYLIKQVRRFGRDVIVLVTGPLTDVDAVITRAPDIASKLRLVMTGGMLTQSDNCWDAVAETNITQDPEAANRVSHSGTDITMVGLDVTHQCLLPQSAADRRCATGTKRGRFLTDLADSSIKANLEADSVLLPGGTLLYDPLMAAVTPDSSLVDCFDLALHAETSTGDFNGIRGWTTGDPVGLVNHPISYVHVALGMDSGRFLDEFVERMAEVCRQLPLVRCTGSSTATTDKLPLTLFRLDSRLDFAYKQSAGHLLYGSARQRGPNKNYFTPPTTRDRSRQTRHCLVMSYRPRPGGMNEQPTGLFFISHHQIGDHGGCNG